MWVGIVSYELYSSCSPVDYTTSKLLQKRQCAVRWQLLKGPPRIVSQPICKIMLRSEGIALERVKEYQDLLCGTLQETKKHVLIVWSVLPKAGSRLLWTLWLGSFPPSSANGWPWRRIERRKSIRKENGRYRVLRVVENGSKAER